MEFEYGPNGSTYYLEFQRKKKLLKLRRNKKEVEILSKYPYTTVRLYRAAVGDSVRELLSEHTVGCVPIDNYSNEQGRITALQGLSKLLPRELRVAVWDAYHRRLEQSVPDKIKSLEAKVERLKKLL